MSEPLKRTLPLCGVISPATRLTRVVLPAPFGPITALTSPGRISREIASAARTPPKRLVRPAICKSGSATAAAFEQTFNPAVQIDCNNEQNRSEDQIGILCEPRQPFF